ESRETIEDGNAPLAVNVELLDQLKTDDEVPLVLRVKSKRAEASNVNVRAVLPALIASTGALIAVENAKGDRLLVPQISTGENGETVLDFSDRLEPGAENRYSIRVRFLPAPRSDTQFMATVTEGGGAATIQSTTTFHLEDGAVKARGTIQTTKAA